MADTAPGTAPVSDNRIAPRGVLPRGTQTWLMIGLALGILGIIVFAGHPAPAARPAPAAAAPALAPKPARIRASQDLLRTVEERTRTQALNGQRPITPPRPT